MIKPLIHLNGTSAQSLADGYYAASSALRLAIGALIDASPNARDYYPLGPDAYEAACSEHEARIAALRVVLYETTELFDHCQEQERR